MGVEARRPNVLPVMADDQGYGDFSSTAIAFLKRHYDRPFFEIGGSAPHVSWQQLQISFYRAFPQCRAKIGKFERTWNTREWKVGQDRQIHRFASNSRLLCH